MKSIIILAFMSFSFLGVQAQSPKPGKYQSADGNYSFSVAVNDDGSLEITEPNKVSVYKKEGALYRHTDPKYSMYLIRVESDTEIYTLKEGNSNEYQFTWIGSDEVSIDDCPLYEKYLEKAEEGTESEVQAWTFCAAAALAKCNYTEAGFNTQAAAIVMTLKQILVNESKCPCEDVIPASIWKNN